MMAITKTILWFKGKLSYNSSTAVIPIHINVEPSRNNEINRAESKADIIVSESSLENDLQFVTRWSAVDSQIPSVVANATIGNLGPFEEQTGESVEMLHIVSTPVVSVPPDVPTITEIAFDGPSDQWEENVQSCSAQPAVGAGGSGISRIVFAKKSVSKVRRRMKPSSYIHMYMTIMYIFGTTAFHTNEPIIFNGPKKWLLWAASRLQMAMFLLVVTLSAFQPFCHAKFNILWFLFEGGFNRFVRFSFNVTCLATSVFGAYTLCHRWKSVEKMVQLMSSYEKTWTKITKRAAFCVPVAMVTVTLAVLESILIIDSDDFSVEDAVLASSSQMGEDLFIWSSTGFNTTNAQIRDEYGTDINGMTLLLALTNMIRNFAFYLHHGMLWDLIGSVVITMHCWINFFMKFVTEVEENVLDENSDEWKILQRKREIVWKMYREIRCVFQAVNDVFGPLLLLFHVTNVLRYAFFLEHCIYPDDFSAFTYFKLLLNIIKSEIIYIVASKIAQKNLGIRKFLRNWGSRTDKISVGYTNISLTAVLDELDMEPLGFGQGNFIIDQSFHFGLCGLVSSLFVMLASKKP